MNHGIVRVLHVVRYLEQGGIQNLIMNLYRNIDRTKIQFDFLVAGESFFDEEVKSMGGRIYMMPYITDIGVKKYQKQLQEFFLNHPEYNIVHCHLNQLSGVVLEVAKKMDIVCRIAHAHAAKNTNHVLGKMYKSCLQRKINKSATHLFACSKQAATWIFKKRAKQAEILENGIEIEKFAFSKEMRRTIRNDLGISENTIVIGHIGRFLKIKNHGFLIDVFHQYTKMNEDSILILIGEGKDKSKVLKKVQSLGLQEKVKFLGMKKNVNEYYSAFDIFLLPSLAEGLGMVLIEAQTNGLDCIASDKVPREVDISGNITFLSLKEGPNTWARKIHKSSRIYKIQNNKIEKFDIRLIAKRLEKFYMDVITKEK